MSQSNSLPFHALGFNSEPSFTVPLTAEPVTTPTAQPMVYPLQAEELTAPVSPSRRAPLVAHWEAIDGKLMCRWVQSPD